MANVQAHEVRFYSQKPHTDKTETVKGIKGDNITFRVQKNNPITAAREFKNTFAVLHERIIKIYNDLLKE